MHTNTESLIRLLDEIECEMRRLEGRVQRGRAALRDRIDPQHRRTDLGYWPNEPQSPRDVQDAHLRTFGDGSHLRTWGEGK